MAVITLFQGFNKPIQEAELSDIIQTIKTDTYSELVAQIMDLVRLNRIEEANLLKRRLPAFTTSALFRGGRTMQHFIEYSGFIVLDLDKLAHVEEVFLEAIKIPYTTFAFKSPSGSGLKIIVEVTSSVEQHSIAFNQVAEFYETQLNQRVDRSGKDVTRLCFMSYDPNAYIGTTAKKFILNQSNYSIKKESTIFQDCVDEVAQTQAYHNGNRNNFVYALACKCNVRGLNLSEALGLIQNRYDLNQKEVESTVKSAYQRNRSGFEVKAIRKNTVITTDATEESDDDDCLLNMPVFPSEIFDQLPEIIKQGCNAFVTDREKDMFLTGALTILSGCFYNVQGLYDQRTVYPNLNCFIVAPAASGKGAFSFSKTLGAEYHKKLLKASIEAKRQYEIELQQFKLKQKNKKKIQNENNEDEPIKPPFKILYIPGNSSSAAVIQHLMDSDGKGIFCETEADTIGNSLKQDWGGYSDLLRKAFHHESVSYSRKTNNEYFEIESPQLSMAISGTNSQVAGLVSSSEDGLFSRIIFYVFKTKVEWRNVAPLANRPNLNQHFDGLSIDVLKAIEFLEMHPTEFNMTDIQWEQLNSECSEWLNEVSLFISEEASSTVKRLGLILFRIAMILTVLRKFENGDTTKKIICEEGDFQTALKLARVYKEHALYMFCKLPKSSINQNGKVKKFLVSLPQKFKRMEAVNIGNILAIKERTVDKYLKEFVTQGILANEEYGFYTKLHERAEHANLAK